MVGLHVSLSGRFMVFIQDFARNSVNFNNTGNVYHQRRAHLHLRNYFLGDFEKMREDSSQLQGENPNINHLTWPLKIIYLF